MQQAAQHHKNMKNRMHPANLGADAIEDRANGIGNSTGQQQSKSGWAQSASGLGDEGRNAPAHADVADHGGRVHRKQAACCSIFCRIGRNIQKYTEKFGAQKTICTINLHVFCLHMCYNVLQKAVRKN